MGKNRFDRVSRLQPLAPNRFVLPDLDALQVEFHRNALGEVSSLSVEQGAAKMRYRRRQPSGP